MITEQHARQIVRYYTARFIETEPARRTWLEQERAVEALTLQLSWYLGRQLNSTNVMDILEARDQIDSVEYGTHPELRVNRAGTVDNTLALLDHTEQAYENEITELLTLAGWTPERAVEGWAA